MNASYKILTPKHLNNVNTKNHTFVLDVLNGLSETPKRLQSKYFYDKKGSELFQKIMGLPEYYLTRCELEIFKTQNEQIVKILSDSDFNLVELGAGDGLKTKVLIQAFIEKKLVFKYVPIDISESAMKALINSMTTSFPDIQAEGIVAEYFDGLKWLSNITRRRNFVLFLGSNLGNFSKTQVGIFLRSLWNTLNDEDYVMIGFDLKKDIDLMLQAYNDSKAITAKFNFNLLKRINRELGGNFDTRKFRFYASYNVFSGAIESYLVSLVNQDVYIGEIGQTFSFKAWEPIHTEYSYKYLLSDVERLARETGFRIVKQLYDANNYFLDSMWQVDKRTNS